MVLGKFRPHGPTEGPPVPRGIFPKWPWKESEKSPFPKKASGEAERASFEAGKRSMDEQDSFMMEMWPYLSDGVKKSMIRYIRKYIESMTDRQLEDYLDLRRKG